MNLQTLTYIGAVSVFLVFLTVVMAGVGLLFGRLCRQPLKCGRDLTTVPWIGWCVTVVVLQVWHLFHRVDASALAFVVGLGCLGALSRVRELAGLIRGFSLRTWCLVPAAAGVAFWVAIHSTTQPEAYDSGLYHLNAVRWVATYPIVPGLGNLYWRVACNNSYFLYVAMLNVGPWVERSHHLANSLLYYMLLAESLGCVWLLFLKRAAATRRLVYGALILVPVMAFTMGEHGSSPSTDGAVLALTLMLGAFLFDLFDQHGPPDRKGADAFDRARAEAGSVPAARWEWSATCVVLAAAVGVTVKLTFAAIACCAVFIVAALCLGVFKVTGLWPKRGLWRWGLIGTAVGLLWMARGVILTGYPLFPLLFGGFPVDWRLHPDVGHSEVSWTRAWARLPDVRYPAAYALSGWHWLKPWALHMLQSGSLVLTPLALGLVLAPCMAAWTRAPGTAGGGPPKAGWLFMAMPVSGLVYWFSVAPDVRFAYALFWVFGMGALTIAVWRLERTKVLAVIASVSVTLFAVDADIPAFLWQWHKDIGPARRVPLLLKTTASGLGVYVPEKGGAQIWNAPLPSTPWFNPALRLRRPGDLSGGFAIDRSESP